MHAEIKDSNGKIIIINEAWLKHQAMGNKKIRLIKYYRLITGSDLKAAKEAIESCLHKKFCEDISIVVWEYDIDKLISMFEIIIGDNYIKYNRGDFHKAIDLMVDSYKLLGYKTVKEAIISVVDRYHE